MSTCSAEAVDGEDRDAAGTSPSSRKPIKAWCVRRQFELLTPIAAKGATFILHRTRCDSLKTCVRCRRSVLPAMTIELLGRRQSSLAEEPRRVVTRDRLDTELRDAADEERQLKNEIENAGGEASSQIPLLIKQHETESANRRERSVRFMAALATTGVAADVTDDASLRAAPTSAGVHQGLEHSRGAPGVNIRMSCSIAAMRTANSARASGARGARHPPHEAPGASCGDSPATLRSAAVAGQRTPVRGGAHHHPDGGEELGGLDRASCSILRSVCWCHRSTTPLSVPTSTGTGSVMAAASVRSSCISASVGVLRTITPCRPFSVVAPQGQSQDGHGLALGEGELEERFDYLCCDTIEQFQAAHDMALTRDATSREGARDTRKTTGIARSIHASSF